MANALIVLKVMPTSTDVKLSELQERIKTKILDVYGNVGEIRVSEEPIAFGLCALSFTFIIDEQKGSEIIETELSGVEGIADARVIDFRRAIG